MVSVLMCLQARCAQELEVSEFVLRNELVSMALAMVAENPEVGLLIISPVSGGFFAWGCPAARAAESAICARAL